MSPRRSGAVIAAAAWRPQCAATRGIVHRVEECGEYDKDQDNAGFSALYLPRRLVDMDRDGHALGAAAIASAAHRGGAKVIEPDRDPHVRLGCTDAVRRIERHPADARHMSLGPGVAGLLVDDAVGAAEIAADVARRDIQMPGGRDEHVGQVLTY